MNYNLLINTPVGEIEIVSDYDKILRILFKNQKVQQAVEPVNSAEIPDVLNTCSLQILEYFKGLRRNFDFPFYQDGTDFQQQVWNELVKIPYGKTIAYTDLAVSLGDKNKIRAVAMANSMNKIAIVVPCHRVIGKDGKLVGYAGGIWRKELLLNLEFDNSPKENRLF